MPKRTGTHLNKSVSAGNIYSLGIEIIKDAGSNAGCFASEESRLSHKEQIKYALLFQKTNNPIYSDKLIASSLNYVITVAKKYSRISGASTRDLAQEGIIGVIDAARRFKSGKNASFLTYASWWIKNRIRRYMHCNRSIVKPPVSYMGGCHKDGSSRSKSIKEDFSLNADVKDSCFQYVDALHSESHHVDEMVLQDFFNKAKEVISSFPERDRVIMFMKFGLDGNGHKNLREISEVVGVTRERVRQVVSSRILQIRMEIGK
jgi:RNA polymerase sigma factor (sigma-70 family)